MIDRNLFEALAPKLAGRPVLIRWQAPYLTNFVGYAMNQNGKAIIDIDPNLIDEETYRVFLHECAHIKFHFALLSGQNEAHKAPKSETLNYYGQVLHDQNPIETEADKQVEKWKEYGEENAWKFFYQGKGIDLCLKALCYYPFPIPGPWDRWHS